MTGDARAPEPGLGAVVLDDGRTSFRVWAPLASRVEVHTVHPIKRLLPMLRDDRGYHTAVLDGAPAGTRYCYRLEGRTDRPDPASRAQPEGVHGRSEVVDPRFPWTDRAWTGIPLEKHVQYELHVGTFTPEGTLDAAASRLDDLADLGITAVELMPVAAFPGRRNWGYDGVYPFAVHAAYGGAAALQRFVNTAHARGLAVILDVVYNHLGPEGNYLGGYGPYFTDRYRTPWGAAVNFDGEGSDEVRRFFIENALMWMRDFHVDALRLDALHAIVDPSAVPFFRELTEAVHAEARRLGREVQLIAEVDRNDPAFVRPVSSQGHGFDAQWNDDFHHALHTLLTAEHAGYYGDFGAVEHLAKAYARGYVYTGEYSAYRRRRHGRPPDGVESRRFVVFAQNHDQVGNRMLGDRLSTIATFEHQKVAAAAVLLSPFVPLLFMGEEYGETAPFLYFVEHGDDGLVEAVRRGRVEEFARAGWNGPPPDPQDPATFERSKLDFARARTGGGAVLRRLYHKLIRLRASVPALADLSLERTTASTQTDAPILHVHRVSNGFDALLLLHVGNSPARVAFANRGGRWTKRLDTADEQWLGPGSRLPAVLDLETFADVSVPPWCAVLWTRDEQEEVAV